MSALFRRLGYQRRPEWLTDPPLSLSLPIPTSSMLITLRFLGLIELASKSVWMGYVVCLKGEDFLCTSSRSTKGLPQCLVGRSMGLGGRSVPRRSEFGGSAWLFEVSFAGAESPLQTWKDCWATCVSCR